MRSNSECFCERAGRALKSEDRRRRTERRSPEGRCGSQRSERTAVPSPGRTSIWWRRGELNPCPDRSLRELLHVYPMIIFKGPDVAPAHCRAPERPRNSFTARRGHSAVRLACCPCFRAVAGVQPETSRSIKPRERDLGDLRLFVLVRILTRPTNHPRHAACASNHQSKPVRPRFWERAITKRVPLQWLLYLSFVLSPYRSICGRSRATRGKYLARNPSLRDELPMAELQDFKGSVALVVSSCDAFFDAWRPFNAFLDKFWPDCPLEIFLVTNELAFRSPRIRALAVGPDRGWSSNFFRARADRAPLSALRAGGLFSDRAGERAADGSDFAEVIESGADSLCFRARSKPYPGFQL